MSQSKVYSVGNVPFSWENSPGICKLGNKEGFKRVGQETRKIPPPPCPKVVEKALQIPLPPCPFQPPLRTDSIRGNRREDPFLAAYKECTKKGSKGKFSNEKKKGRRDKAGRSASLFSCKQSCEVREDSFVRMANVPAPSRMISNREIQRARA